MCYFHKNTTAIKCTLAVSLVDRLLVIWYWLADSFFDWHAYCSAVPPSVKVSRNTTVQEGYAVTLTCRFGGKPYPRTQWLKNGELINANNVRIMVDQTKVAIRKTTASDAGKYTCRASHEYGRAEDSTYLTIISKQGTNGKEEGV